MPCDALYQSLMGHKATEFAVSPLERGSAPAFQASQLAASEFTELVIRRVFTSQLMTILEDAIRPDICRIMPSCCMRVQLDGRVYPASFEASCSRGHSVSLFAPEEISHCEKKVCLLSYVRVLTAAISMVLGSLMLVSSKTVNGLRSRIKEGVMHEIYACKSFPGDRLP
jgi:hypothetical protein